MTKAYYHLDHISLADLTAHVRPERWQWAQPATLIMMFPIKDGLAYLRNIPPLRCLRGSGHNRFAGEGQPPFSVLSLAFWGRMRWINGAWYVEAEGMPFLVKMRKEADLGIIRQRLASQELAYFIEGYVREHPPSAVDIPVDPA